MVNPVCTGIVVHHLAQILAALDDGPLLRRLSPAMQLRVVLALVILLLLGLAMVMIVRVGARVARRYARRNRAGPCQTTAPDDDDWSHKPLAR